MPSPRPVSAPSHSRRPDDLLSRRTLLARLAALGIGGTSVGCRDAGDTQADAPAPGTVQSVIIVGAGAAGLTAAHLLGRRGVQVMILEAASFYGGRMKHDRSWLDFPIPLGAGWLHVDPSILAELADAETVAEGTQVAGYGPADQVGTYDGALSLEPLVDTDLVFVGSSWLDVFETYVLPDLAGALHLDRPVAEIEATDEGVRVTERGGATHHADAVIVTVPPTILRDGDLPIRPALPGPLRDALAEVEVWGGLKVFLTFSQRFYPAQLVFPDSFTPAGEYLYFDAAHAQPTRANVLGFFAVGAPADRYRAATEAETIAAILAQLDGIFDGAASRTYLDHRVQDWNQEPFVRQAYLANRNPWQLVRQLGQPVSARILLAGDSYSDGEDWGSVDVAIRSAQTAVRRLVGG